MTTPASLELAYAPRPPWHRKRRVRRYVLLFLVTVGACIAWHWRGAIQARGRLWQSQRACLNYTASPDTIAYVETDADSVGQLMMSEPGYVPDRVDFSPTPNVARRTVPEWDHLREMVWGPQTYGGGGLFGGGGPGLFGTGGTTPSPPAPPLPKSQTVIDSLPGPKSTMAITFLHKRVSAGGRPRLVAVDLYRGSDKSDYWLFRATGYQYSALGGLQDNAPLELLEVRFVDATGTQRLGKPCCFFGQVDTADAAHFTIEYELDGKLGTIDGRLMDDGRVVLSVRDGPVPRPNTSSPAPEGPRDGDFDQPPDISAAF